MFTFYHADRAKTLQQGQRLEVNERGLSQFGSVYWDRIHNMPIDQMDDAVLREHCLEMALHKVGFSWSRHCSFFAAETIEEAIVFASAIDPRPETPVPIFEIKAMNASLHDMNWLDFDVSLDKRIANAECYWRMEATNHQPIAGPRRPPRWEVVIPLPAIVGAQVATVLI